MKNEHIFLSESCLCLNNTAHEHFSDTVYVMWSVDDFKVSGIVADFYLYMYLISLFFPTALSQADSTVDIGEV